MKKVLYILRGLPGAGKSTLAKSLSSIFCEADEYFMKDGKYLFDASKLGEAHEWCRLEVERAMKWDYTAVVSNTFTTEKELKPYYELAEKYGYKVVCLIIENRHGGINTHGVPSETLNRMEVKLKNSIKLR
jgi:predicted kinase